MTSKKKIKKISFYGLLKKDVKDSVLQGHWKISIEKKLSWNDLLDYTPMSRAYGSLEYHTLSMYAHSSHASLQLEAQHDYNMDGALAHLYKLSSLMCYATVEAYLIPSENFTKREIVIMQDLATMGESFSKK